MIELERDSNLYPNGNFVEWHKSPNQADVDGFEIKRHGDENVKVKVILHLDNSPERFKLSPELAEVLCVDVETRPGIMLALWQYIKFHQLQDPEEKRNINCDQKLAAVSSTQMCLLVGAMARGSVGTLTYGSYLFSYSNNQGSPSLHCQS